MQPRRLLFFVLLLCVGVPGFSQVEFVGYLQSPDGARFVVRQGESGAVSRWLGLGDAAFGFKLLSHDRKLDRLVVEGENGRLELPLKTARTLPLPAWKQKLAGVTVRIAGTAPISADAVRDKMQSRAGNEIDPRGLDQDLRTIYRLGHFESVEIQAEVVDPHAFNLVVLLTPKATPGGPPAQR